MGGCPYERMHKVDRCIMNEMEMKRKIKEHVKELENI